MKKTLFCILGAYILLNANVLAHDIVPGKTPPGPIALVGGNVYTMTEAPLKGGTVIFNNGFIQEVGIDIAIPEGATVIQIPGKNVYPGLISPNTALGLIEIGAVRATTDVEEVGDINPNARGDSAYNTDSEIIPTIRSNGILVAEVAPKGGILSGTSSLLMLDGWTKEDVTLVKNVGIHLQWPQMSIIQAWWMDKTPEEQQEENQEKIKALQKIFIQAHKYYLSHLHGEKTKIDSRWEAMLSLFSKEMKLFVHASDYRQIESSVAFCKKYDLEMVLVGGGDAWKLTGLLKENNIPVVLQATCNLPRRQDEAYDIAFRLPHLLHKAGVKFCLSLGDEWDAYWNMRNLPYQAGYAVAFGLDKEAALKSITLWPAEILGAAEKIGSLEKGKEATLIVSQGDILDIRTSKIEYAFIQGRPVNLDNRHKRLYRKYQKKYE